MHFAVPTIWREPTNHENDCYFCVVNIYGFSKKTLQSIVYPDFSSATRPGTHSSALPIPFPPFSIEDACDFAFSAENEEMCDLSELMGNND